MQVEKKCSHIKSKKNPTVQCESSAKHGLFCSIHNRCKHKTLWKKATPIFTRTQRVNGLKIMAFFKRHTCSNIRKRRGVAVFVPTLAKNDTDIYTFDTVDLIPFTYRFSYVDSHKHVWIFDSRFLLGSLQYEGTLMNPFTQEEVPSDVIVRLQSLSEFLQKHSLPFLYASSEILTPEQIWNQKVLDVFLRIRVHGYGVNVIWFENLRLAGHIRFYTKLYTLWNTELQLTEENKERIVPNHSNILFKFHPERILYEHHTLKWWMKQNLSLMHTLLSSSPDKANRGCAALYILTAFAYINPDIAQVYPWL